MKRRGRGSIGAAALRSAHSGDAARVNVTPLIDVVMVLIVFFLIVGNLAEARRGSVRLPGAQEGEPLEPADAAVIVAIDADGGVTVDGEPVPTELAGAAVSEATGRREASVELRADRSLPFGEVRGVLRSLREAGITSIDMAAREGGGGPAA